jgi:hypothetical protein
VVTPAGIVYQSIARERYLLRWYRDGKTETFVLPGQAFTPSVPASGAPIYFELAKGSVSHIADFHPDSGRVEISPLEIPNPHEPAISHDGKLLAVVSGDSLFLFDGVNTRKLPTPAPVGDPSFVPGDRGIVFSVSAPESSRIYLFDLDTNSVRTILSRQGPVARPSVSPDKSRILFASPETSRWHTGSWQIWFADLPIGQPTQLTGGDCNNSMPAWGLVSDQIVFASDCGRGLGLPALYRADHIAGPARKFPK